jgi:hypothetical protein
MLGNVQEIIIVREHQHIVADAQFRKQSIDGSDLNSGTATIIPQLRCANVIVTVWDQQRYCGKSLQNLVTAFWPREPLQELLKNQAGGKDCLADLD